MRYSGNEKSLVWDPPLQKLEIDGSKRPDVFPTLTPGKFLFAGLNQGLGVNIFLCETIADMQEIYDGHRKTLTGWYTGPEPRTN